MQAIVADTTPLNYLVLIQAADILPNLYRTVLIPPAVKAELAHANTPAVVRAWISQPPAWLEVVSLKQPVDSALEHLDAGEREAISLASELQAILLLMDERDGVTIARHRGLKVVGTLAALDLAAAHGLVDLQTMFERLRATTFRSPSSPRLHDCLTRKYKPPHTVKVGQLLCRRVRGEVVSDRFHIYEYGTDQLLATALTVRRTPRPQ